METVYAALLLHKAGQVIDEEHLKKVLHASGAKVDDSKIKSLVVSLKDIDIDKELEAAIVSSGAPVQSSSNEARIEEPKEEKREAAAEGLSALFG